ncbi:MAG: division/cell wall cluster transcriptional repressor MraZ [Bacteroidaceae bacterium]|nr:division/cell wall cluster transcriptional repressor MraZ [Bacteroidaceae bacterium]
MRFYGTIEAKTDAKGRIFLPSSFRKILTAESQEKLYMRKDAFQECLVLYPEKVWNEQIDLLCSRVNRYNKQHQMVMRQFLADVEELTLDSNGRFLIPKRYLAMASIKQDVEFLGFNDTIEIWAKEKREMSFMESNDFSEQLQSLMADNH